MNVRVYGPDHAEIHTIKTSATGSNWVPLSDGGAAAVACRAITIFNTTGTDLSVRRNGQVAVSGADLGYMTLPDGSSRTFGAIRSSTDLSIRRKDINNTQVDVEWEAETV